ncbi:MAG: sugar phosphate isomerase/epimerase family protein [Gemmataceae bacterium]
MIRVGNQSAFSASPFTLPFDFALQQGFEAFEWFPDRRTDAALGWSASDISAAQRQEFRTRARDVGMRLSVHAPIESDPLRVSSHRGLEDSLRLAVDLGAAVLNIHFSEPHRVEEFARALGPWVDRCGVAGIKLSLENVPGTGPEDFNRLFALLPGSRNGVGMCLDIGHANLHHTTRNDYIGYIDRLRPEVPIVHLHLHENHGDRDSHLVLFTGPAGRDPAGLRALLERLARRGYSGSGILEQWPDPPSLLVTARDRLNALMREVQP